MEWGEISEHERLQMEHIRGLEDEELEIEEVEEEELSDDDGYGGSAGASLYDISIVALHSYLGEVEDTHHRLAFLDGGAVLTLPLFYLEGVVLFPEATLPLRVIFPNLIAGVQRAMGQVDAPYTIGVGRLYRDADSGRIRFSTIGTTAEIKQFRTLEDGSLNIVARGQQRFRLQRHWLDVDGALCGEIQIIQEDVPLRMPRDVVGKLIPLRKSAPAGLISSSSRIHLDLQHEEANDSDEISGGSFERGLSSAERQLHESALFACGDSNASDVSSSDDENLGVSSPTERSQLENSTSPIQDSKKLADSCSGVTKRSQILWGRHSINKLRDAPRAFWPSWVYQIYDSYSLAIRAADRWKKVVKTPNLDNIVMKPDLLSFHIASKLPLSESSRQELLEIDGTSYRLRKEIELLDSFDKLKCKTCLTLVAKRSDMLVMSSDGPLGAYANPHGFVHEVMTLIKTTAIGVTGRPVKEHSWFPGYAWSLTDCTMCGAHMGWYFTATRKNMKPPYFWGLRSSQVVDDTQ